MNCICREYFKIGYIEWFANEYYNYYTTTHPETNMTIYYVGHNSYYIGMDNIPFTYNKFNDRFSDTEYLRDEKLKQLLNG